MNIIDNGIKSLYCVANEKKENHFWFFANCSIDSLFSMYSIHSPKDIIVFISEGFS